jgi:hypothetical protein
MAFSIDSLGGDVEKGQHGEKSTEHDVDTTTVPTPTHTSPQEATPINNHHSQLERTQTQTQPPTSKLTTLAKTLTTRSNASLLDPGPPPDGGTKAWTQACMGHLVILNTWGMVATFGVFQTYYTQELGLEASAVSWIGSLQMLGHFGLGEFDVLLFFWGGRLGSWGFERLV